MTEILVSRGSTSLPSVFTARPEARTRMRDFFGSHIRNPNTRRACRGAVRQFSAFCAEHGVEDLAQAEPVHVAAFVETQLKTQSKPTLKLRLAALLSRCTQILEFPSFVINHLPVFDCRFTALKSRNSALEGRTKFRRKFVRPLST